MDPAPDADADADHPLVVELSSLRQTAARFQHEAHAAAIKLQRHSLEASRLHEHAAALEQENARLSHELGVLRAHPDVPYHPAVAQVQELSLALRRVSDKIALTEETLLDRTSQLTDARSELLRARNTADAAYELAARMRAREEASKARERELDFKARASEEERKMVDLVVQEYADLVRNLEGRKSVNHIPAISCGSAAIADTLQDSKSMLHRNLTAFSTESDNLHATITELNARLSDLQMTLDAERSTASHDRTLLSQVKTELDKLNLEDQTAAKMVARYMKFSQASTNALQEQITTLKTRHASTITTLELQLSIAESQLASERARTLRLQDALDELCEDLARESYGRRREVSLRLALLSREEGVAEFMRRWARRARESYSRYYDSTQQQPLHISSGATVQEAFHRVVSDAESLLSSLDDEVQISDATRTSGSLARILLSREAVDTLRSELQGEVQKRVEAVQKFVFSLTNGCSDATLSVTEDIAYTESPPSQDCDGSQDQSPVTPNGSAMLEHKTPLVELTLCHGVDSPVTKIGSQIGDPFVVPAPISPIINETTEHTIVQEEISSPSLQESASTSATLLVDEEPKAVQSYSPAVSMLDLQQDFRLSPAEELPTSDMVPIRAPQIDTPGSPLEETQNAQTLAEDNIIIPAESLSNRTPAAPRAGGDQCSPAATLLSELGNTKYRYGFLQRAFRDCSLALKDLKRSLASSSFSSQKQTVLCQHLETALARIDDYAEDARVELEIRVADEELTVRGFQTVLSVPGALVDLHERAEVEASARTFVDGTDEGVCRALERFRKKLEDVQHDVAVVKRAVHGLEMFEGDEMETEEEDGDVGAGWTAWTAGLLGANTTRTPSRSPTPVQTFGAVMTSPRLRHAASLKQLHAHDNPDRGPLAGLDLRIPMPLPPPPSPSPSRGSYPHLGLGRAMEGRAGPRTISAMYAVGGLRSASSVGLGVGLGGSPSSVRARNLGVHGAMTVRLDSGSGSSPLRGGRGGGNRERDADGDIGVGDTRGTSASDVAVHDLGAVE